MASSLGADFDSEIVGFLPLSVEEKAAWIGNATKKAKEIAGTAQYADFLAQVIPTILKALEEIQPQFQENPEQALRRSLLEALIQMPRVEVSFSVYLLLVR